MALVVNLLLSGESWRFEGADVSKVNQALGANSRRAVSTYKRSPDDAKWVLVAYDEHRVVAAVERKAVREVAGKLQEFPELKAALETP